MDRLWQAFLRRFDLEHTFRLFKQVLGWTVPKIRDPAAADRWTWLIIACHAQLRLARPWLKTCAAPGNAPPGPDGSPRPGSAADSGTSARRPPSPPVHRNPANPAPAGPPGSKNRHPAPRHDVGKTTKRELTLKARREQAG